MAEKKLPRHRRMYSDSPKLERGEDGNMAAKKPSDNDKRGEKASNSEKEADSVQAGLGGEEDMEPSEDARIQEIKDMHTRHETEMKAIHKRHQKEDVKKYAKENHDGDNNEADGAGKKEISEVDQSKENTE